MGTMAKFRSYADSLLHRSRREDEIADEMQFHIETRAEDLERAGMPHAEAMRRARVEFGGVEGHRAGVRASLGLRWMDELGGDLRYAWRMLMRSKGFTAVAVGSLALGIGANTIIFSLAKGVLLDRLTVPHPEQLRMITVVGGENTPMHGMWGSWYEPEGHTTQYPMTTYPIYKLLQQQNREHPVLGDIFAFKELNNRLTASINGHAEVVTGQMVSGNFYEELGVRPQVGRTIEPVDDGVAGTGNVIMISDGLWTHAFGRSADVIGKSIAINLVPMTIVGVNPPGFSGASSVQAVPDVFFPLSMQPVLVPMSRADKHPSVLDITDLWWTQVMARTRPGVPVMTAQAAVSAWMGEDIRGTMKVSKGDVMPKTVLMAGSRGIAQTKHAFTTQIYVLGALTGLVLLLACANLANLLLARSSARQREMAVRLALGASRGRILRQVLTESLLLSSLGGAAGVALGYLGRNVVPRMYSPSWQLSNLRGDFDGTVMAGALGMSLLTGVMFGVWPAWQATRTPVNSGLKDAVAVATRRRKGVAGRGLVIVQVTLSMLLVVCAGLFGGTLRNLYKENLGFDPTNVVLFSVPAPEARYPSPQEVQLYERIEDRLGRVAGVSAVTASSNPLVGGGGTNYTFYPTGQVDRGMPDAVVMVQEVGRSFFDVYRTPVMLGRGFRSEDTATSPKMGVVNEALAQKFWPNSSPVGQTFKLGIKGKSGIYQIVGVVGDAKYMSLGRAAPPTLYMLYEQMESEPPMTYAVKTVLPSGEVIPRIRAAVADIDRDLPVRDVRTQQAQIDATTAQQRVFAVLTAVFGVLALVLACIGIYGLMAYDVARRTSEIGIRMALGARASQMMVMVLCEASWMAVVGIAMGLGGALMLSKYVKSMLYGLAPNDPWILGSAGVLLLVVALAAAFGPARRAARIEPMEALRHE